MATLLSPLGCGKSEPAGDVYNGATIAGTVVEGGKPVKFKPNETVTVGFMMIEGEGAEKVSFGAEIKPEDGSFTMSGPSGGGIPAGRYKVLISSSVYGGGDGDRFEAKFSTSGTAQMIAEVGPGPGQSFTIDLTTRKIKKQ